MISVLLKNGVKLFLWRFNKLNEYLSKIRKVFILRKHALEHKRNILVRNAFLAVKNLVNHKYICTYVHMWAGNFLGLD